MSGRSLRLWAWDSSNRALDPLWSVPRADYRAVAGEVNALLPNVGAEWVLFWDDETPALASNLLEELMRGRADAIHGAPMHLRGEPKELDYVRPTWVFTLDPGVGEAGVSWRLSLFGLLIRVDVLRSVDGLDTAYRGFATGGLDLGYRLLQLGGIVVSDPRLTAAAGSAGEDLTGHDRAVFLRRHLSAKWRRYAALRGLASTGNPLSLATTYVTGRNSVRATPPPDSVPVPERPPAQVDGGSKVSVILPTLGRYELLRPLLAQFRGQTVPPLEIICVDQSPAELRAEAPYAEFEDLPLNVVFQDQQGQWLARNTAVMMSRGEWLTFIDDDSEIRSDFIEQHLDGLARYRADLSTGASLAVVGAPVPENYSYFRAGDQFDSGNGMCRRELIEKVGAFDEQFDRMRRGDAEFGLRVQLAGGLVIHNPNAVRSHLKAASGGLRSFGSWDGFRSADRSKPLPLPSMVYYTKRYHTRRQVREDLLLGIAQAIVPYELKRRATLWQWARYAIAELRHVPSTVRRVRQSLNIADRMVAEGPRIPRLPIDGGRSQT